MTNRSIFQKLDERPRLNHTHQWADYIELLALTSVDRFYSQGYLQELEGEIEDLNRDMEDVDFDEAFVENNLPDDNEKLNRRWAEIKICLHSRHQRFGDAWPFELKNDVLYVNNVDAKNGFHRLYIALLLASSLRYISASRQKEITSSLEEIGFRIFCNLMPPTHWIVKPFGAHQQIANGYQGTLFNKITKLAEDLNTKCIAEKETFKKGNSGDGGLDLVAWHPMSDTLGHIPVAFAQCGCSLDDLKHKQLEAHAANWRNKIHIQHPHANYYFAPHDLRKNTGHWDEELGEVIMIDRMRILHLAKLYQFPIEHVSWGHVDEAISSYQDEK
jgi:hypothetical protein